MHSPTLIKSENTAHSLPGNNVHKKSSFNSAMQFADNRTETLVQRKLFDMANNNADAVQLKSVFNTYSVSQMPFQLNKNGNLVAQLEHKKGASRVVEARKRKNANKRKKAIREREQSEQEAQEWSDTVSEWTTWAWEKAKGVGLAVVKKTAWGIDPFEVAKNLYIVYNSNASIKTKVTVLALYGSYEVSNFLKENIATLIGGDTGTMMELEKEMNEQLGNLANLWENGEIEEGQVEEGIADQLINAFGGE